MNICCKQVVLATYALCAGSRQETPRCCVCYALPAPHAVLARTSPLPLLQLLLCVLLLRLNANTAGRRYSFPFPPRGCRAACHALSPCSTIVRTLFLFLPQTPRSTLPAAAWP